MRWHVDKQLGVPPDFGTKFHACNYVWLKNTMRYFVEVRSASQIGSIDPTPSASMPVPSWSGPLPIWSLRWLISSEKCDMFEVAPVHPDFGRKTPCIFLWKCVLPLRLGSIDPTHLAAMPVPSWSVPLPIWPLRWLVSSEKCDMFGVATVPPDFGRKTPCVICWKCVLPLRLGSIDPTPSAAMPVPLCSGPLLHWALALVDFE
jgi:hypothetical protein